MRSRSPRRRRILQLAAITCALIVPSGAWAQPSTPRIALLGGDEPGGVFGSSNIFAENVGGTGRVQITSGTFTKETPDWSADGQRLVYTSTGGEFGPASIFTIRSDGTGRTRLTTGNHFDIEPDWSPDGGLIAFASDRAGNPNYEIYVMKPDGSGLLRITRLNGSDGSPDWSPDGRRIAFDHNFDGIFVMNADGSSIRRLTSCEVDGCFEEDQAAWSPDGSVIAFLWGRDPHYEIRTVNADGTGARVVLDCRRPCLSVEGPAWSRDGSMIAFTYIDMAAARHAYVMHADGTGVRPLPSGSIETCCVAWQPA